MGRWGVAVRGGDCAGISLEAEDRATKWSRGAGWRLRVDGGCVVPASPFTHGHAEALLEQPFEVVGSFEAAVASDLEDGVSGLFELPTHFGKADAEYVFQYGLSADLPEAQLKQTARCADVPDDVDDPDALAGVFADVGARLFDQRGRRRDVR